MKTHYYHHYITVNERNCVTDGWSDGPHLERTPAENDILLNSKGGYQFRLFPDGEENPALFTDDGIPLYKWDGVQVLARTEEEIEEDRAALPEPEPTEMEKLRADVDYIMVMEGLL